MQSQSYSALQKLNSMDKIHFLRILGIMKRLRMDYEMDCVFHWHYKLHYSTKWMGVDKSAVIVLDLKKCPMPEMGSSSDEEKLEAERLMSFNHPMVQRLAGVDVPVEDDCIMLGCMEAEVMVISQKCMCPDCRPKKARPSETATAETFRHYNQK